MTIYIKTQKYNDAIAKLVCLEPCPFAGRITEDQIKLALGELFNIWPASIADDPQSE